MKALITILAFAALISSAGASVHSVNNLGLALGMEISKQAPGKNFMVSPVSLHQALSIAANGTNHETRSRMEDLFGITVEENNLLGMGLKKSLTQRSHNKLVHLNKGNVVAIENSLWRTNGKTDKRNYVFSPDFLEVSSQYFEAEAYSLDFRNTQSARTINQWADKKTRGLVKEIIDADTLDPMLWVIMNATYMEAAWAKPFHKIKENAPRFTLLNKSQVEVRMIGGRQSISYSKMSDGSEVAAIPFSYSRGNPDLEFIVYLPHEKKDFSKARNEFFTPAFFDRVTNAHKGRVDAVITLPEFSFDSSVEMKKDKELTKVMGLNFLFQNSADLSLMATRDSLPSVVGIIKQNSRIELDEKGVKAAAVTIVGGIERTSLPVEPSVQMVIDRPFFFAIVEKNTKAILFTGSVVDPR
ncbi:MAG: serpin family protein [Bacteriovoracia bacterium]